MSQTIDHRVVEMRFDNKQFETGAKQTMGTLARLKEALKLPDSTKALEGIDEAAKNISLDGIAAGVDALNARFSTMGIVGMRVIQNITDGLMNKLNTAVNFVSDSIISGGIKRAMNIENAHFQLQALLKDETKVQAVMADAMESVDGTAYAYDEAAKAAAQFSASGIQAGEEMLGALKGITGVAAMTNSQFADISMIFTTVAGNGRLMGDQLLQLSSRGLNAASTLADYFKEVKGQSKMTEGAIRDMVSKGKISFKDFSEAMTWAFGDSAKRANETFTGALSNMKSALARIGAGFISPLVEQNGELVNLFNALRIKINDVKTSLVFDEQSSAISGLTKKSKLLDETLAKAFQNENVGIDKFIESLLKASDQEDKYGYKTRKLTEIMSELNEKGKLSSDMFETINKYGLNATEALRTYISGVRNGTIGASDSMKKMVNDVSNGIFLVDGNIKKLVEDGKISSEIFTAAMTRSAKGAMDSSELITVSLKDMFAAVKEEGHVTAESLKNMSDNGMNAKQAIMDYMIGVRKGTIRASYATRSAIEEISEGLYITSNNLDKMVEDGKISFDIFQSAMEHSFGDSKSLSKQFTDSFLDMLHKIVTAINEADMTKPMEVFYYGVESVKNLAKGLLSVLSPIGKAFADVFLSFSGDDVVNFASSIEELTAKMRLSEKGSKNLHDAFEGVFNVAKLLVDIFFALFGAIVPINKPVMEMGDGFLGLAGSLGRALTWITKMIRSCTLLKKGFTLVKGGINMATSSLSSMIKIVRNFVGSVYRLEGTQKLVESISNVFERLGKKVAPYVEAFIKDVEDLFRNLFKYKDLDTDTILGTISKAFSDLSWEIDNFSLKEVLDAFDNLKKKLQDFKTKLVDLAMSNKGFATFVENIQKYAEKLKGAFGKENIMDNLSNIRENFGKFIDWLQKYVLPAFDDFTIGGAAATGVGLGIVVGLLKISGAFKKISEALGGLSSKVGKTLDVVKGTLVAYQKDLKASAMLKVAAAIAVLAGALLLLSFADANGLLAAGFALAAAGGALSFGIGKLLEAIGKWNSQDKAITVFAKGVKGFLNKLGRAREIRAIGASFKNFGKAIFMIGATILGIALMYRKDPKALKEAGNYIVEISVMLVSLQLISDLMGKAFGNNEGFKNAGKGVVALAASLFVVVAAMEKLFNMAIPSNYQFKLNILAQCLAGVAILALILGVAGRIAGGGSVSGMKGSMNWLGKEGKSFAASSNGGSLNAAPILALAGSLYVVVAALNKLFGMGIPSDYQLKIQIMAGIMVGLGLLMIAMGVAGKLSGGAIKAATTILALTAFLVIIVGALFILSLIPGEKLLNGAEAFGIVLVALATSLAGAGKIIKPEAAKVVFNMAIMVGVITAALAVLSIIPFENLMKAAVALDSVLLSLAFTFKNAAKSGKGDWQVVLAMVAETVVIAYALYKLAEQPWGNLLAASASISIVLLSLMETLKMISSRTGLKPEKMNQVLKSVIVLGVIAASLYFLADKDWLSLVVAAVSLSGVMLALVGVFKILSGTKVSIGAVVGFAACAVALIPAAYALSMLGGYTFETLAPGLIALGAIALGLTLALAVLGGIGPMAIAGAAAFAIAMVSLIPAAYAMQILGEVQWQNISENLSTLGNALLILGVAGVAGVAIAPGLLLLSIALIAFGGAMTVVGVGLVTFTASLLLALGLLATLLKIIGSSLPEFINMGRNLIAGFIAGIVEGFKSVIDTVKKVAGGVINGVKEVLGIHSPSTVLEMLGINTDEGFALGIAGGSGAIDESLNSVFGGIGDKIAGNLGGMFDLGNATGQEFSSGLNAGVDTSALADGMSNEFSTAVSNDPSYFDAGGMGASNFKSGFSEESSGIGNMMSEAMSSFGGNMDMSQMYGAGGLSAESLMSGFTGGFNADQVASSMNTGLSEAVSNDPAYFDAGGMGASNLTAGFTEGIDNTQFYNLGTDSSSQFLEGFQTGTSESIGEVADEVARTLKESLKAQDLSSHGKETMEEFAKEAISAIQNERTSFKTEGIQSAKYWINGVITEYPDSVTAGLNLAIRAISGIKQKLQEFQLTGQDSAIKYLEGIKSKYADAFTVGGKLAQTIMDGFKNSNQNFYTAGSNAGQGYVDGLKSKLSDVIKISKQMGEASEKSTAKALDERSPSRKMKKIGKYAGLGFINGLVPYIMKAYESGEKMGEEIVDGAKYKLSSISYVYDDLNLNPVISPMVDLSDVRRSAFDVKNMFNNAVKDMSADIGTISSIVETRNGRGKVYGIDSKNDKVVENNISYTQNNYSPKALDPIDIYRNTKNQISTLKNKVY